MFTTLQLRSFDSRDLNAEIAHARNRRDAYAEGREPAEVLATLRQLTNEQARRRARHLTITSR